MASDFEFESEPHIYSVKKRIVPSVSNVLRTTGISRDLSMVRPDVLRHKRAIGNVLHECARLYQLRKLDVASVDPQVRGYLDGLLLWIKETGFKVEKMELRQWKAINGMVYAGTLDATGLIKGEPWMVDWKTSQGPPDYGWSIQLAGYDLMTPPPMIPPFKYRRMSVQLRENGRYKQKEWDDPGDYDEWRWALGLTWRRVNRGAKVWEDQ